MNKDQIEVGVNGFTYKNINELKSLILKYENMGAEEKKNLKISTRNSVLKHGEVDLAEKILLIYEKSLKVYFERSGKLLKRLKIRK